MNPSTLREKINHRLAELTRTAQSAPRSSTTSSLFLLVLAAPCLHFSGDGSRPIVFMLCLAAVVRDHALVVVSGKQRFMDCFRLADILALTK
jgi:hypothetical protein